MQTISAPTTPPLRVGVRPEIELFLCCARTRLEERHAARLRELLDGALDWDFIQSFGRSHGLLPLLYSHLHACAPEKVPPAVYEKLREQFRRISALNLYLSGELLRLLKLFAAHDIAAIPYKGPALAALAYGNIALRHFGDLDILVRPRDVLRVMRLLVAEGYTLHPPLNDVQQALMLRTQCNLPFTRDAHRLIVEIHWRVSARLFSSPLDEDALWENPRHVAFEGTQVNALAPEDLLLSLCVHGAKHLWERLSWIADIAQLLEVHPDLNWEGLLERARRTGTERMLLLGLHVAHDLLGARVPAQVGERMQADREIVRLADQIYARLFGGEHEAGGMSGYFMFQLKARRRLRDKLNYCRYVVSPTEEDLTLLPLPAPLSFIYYLLRPLRMLWTGGPSHLQH
ncbi:MAG TPA: nucleotidyltransferase family protein [Pyrinomonadaceae bacterium]|nr:nucleotidyltransferase family protein [Pyrinomonadaceae bacterium]